jgi:SAM-dependent methyltransferase
MAEIDSRIFDSTFWEKAWAEAGRLRRDKTGIKSSSAESASWDRRAGYFDSRVSGIKGSARIEALMRFLRDEQTLTSDMKILDVGCGNGSITVLLAEAAKEVYALDPSEKMLAILQKKIMAAKLSNVRTEKGRWQDISLDKKGWYDYFDLSFASMSPGVDDAGTLRKLIASSRKYCYLSTFAGRRDKARREIWELVTGRTFLTADLDIVYPLNLLYACVYRPSLRFHRHYRCAHLPPLDAVEELWQYVQAATGKETATRETVEKYVTAGLKDGLFPYELEIYHGMLIWDKNAIISAGRGR